MVKARDRLARLRVVRVIHNVPTPPWTPRTEVDGTSPTPRIPTPAAKFPPPRDETPLFELLTEISRGSAEPEHWLDKQDNVQLSRRLMNLAGFDLPTLRALQEHLAAATADNVPIEDIIAAALVDPYYQFRRRRGAKPPHRSLRKHSTG